MPLPDSWPLAAVVRLRAALETAAEALTRPSVEGLLAAEGAIIEATERLSALAMLGPAERAAVREEALAASAALARCRRLGAALGDFVRVSLDARGQGTGYRGAAEAAAGTLAGRGFHARV